MKRQDMDSETEQQIADAVRQGLAGAEPASVPPFARVFALAQRAVASPGSSQAQASQLNASRNWRPALAFAAAALVASAGLLLWQRAQRDDARLQAEDYALAVHVASIYGSSVPTDRLPGAAPQSLFRGAPSIPKVEYPLMPKETLL